MHKPIGAKLTGNNLKKACHLHGLGRHIREQ